MCMGVLADANAPHIYPQTTTDYEHLLVLFDPGALWACTVFQRQTLDPPDVYSPDGHYTPRHCWGLDKTTTRYNDDWAFIPREMTKWHVWAEIGYPDRTNPAGFELKYIRTNVLEVVH